MTLTDLKNDVYFWTGLSANDTSAYSLANVIANINRAYDRVVGLILQADGRWQWDDTNQTDYPISTTSLVSGQQDYVLSTEQQKISRVEVLDSTGSWHLLTPIDKADLYNSAITDFLSAGGLPLYYDKTANSLFLYPAPNYSVAAGLKVFFQRGPSYFTTSDTTKSPGFNTLYHRYLSMSASYDYALKNSLDITKVLRQEMLAIEKMIQDDYSSRANDEKPAFRARIIKYK